MAYCTRLLLLLQSEGFNHLLYQVKIMADMDIAEKRLPQDGKIQFKFGNEIVDIRVATLPIINGESIDLRILPRVWLVDLYTINNSINTFHKKIYYY